MPSISTINSLECIGLDNASMQAAQASLCSFFGEIHLDSTRDFNPPHTGQANYVRYAPILSFLESLHGYQLDGVKIIEIGVEIAGLGFLAYLQSRGAVVLGIDRSIKYQNLASRLSVDFQPGYWENLPTMLERREYGKTDIIMTCGMNPRVAERSPLIGNFGKYIGERTISCLSPGGIYLNHFVPGPDFIFSSDDLIRLGCSYHTAFTNHTGNGAQRQMQVFQLQEQI